MHIWLNDSTELLTKHFEINQKNVSDTVKKYNLHKLRHSIWVLEAWRLILTKYEIQTNKLEDNIKKDCEIIFLLHDLWRFYQNDKERILDWKEFDHWEKSYEIMKKEWFDIKLCLAVKYHDKISYEWIFNEDEYFNLNTQEQEYTIFLTKMLKDADKLQNILYTLYDIEKLLHVDKDNIEDWDVSPIALQEFTEYKLINRYNLKTKADYILLVIAWYFDIYFQETRDILYFNNFILILLSRIQETNISSDSFSIIKQSLFKYNTKI